MNSVKHGVFEVHCHNKNTCNLSGGGRNTGYAGIVNPKAIFFKVESSDKIISHNLFFLLNPNPYTSTVLHLGYNIPHRPLNQIIMK